MARVRLVALAPFALSALFLAAACTPAPYVLKEPGAAARNGPAAGTRTGVATIDTQPLVGSEADRVPAVSATSLPPSNLRTSSLAPIDTAADGAAPPRPASKPGMGTALEAVTGPLTVEVGRGDTVHGIARRYGSSAREIIALNDLSAPYRLRVGQQIRLPHGRFYTVQKGETLYGIAQRSGVDLGVLVRENKIAPPYRVAAGIRLKLPVTQAVETADTEWAKPVVEARLEPMANDSFVVPRRRPHTTDEAIPLSGDKFLWPIEGPLISKFGPKPDGKHNDGINIAVPVGSEVRASQNGVVAYAGNELRGYGNLILIRHSDGWMTAYAHNDTLLVEKGEAVRRGQVISWSGKSGRVSRPQAHFEIRRNGKPQDPLLLLSRR